jgi:hypothetical protein
MTILIIQQQISHWEQQNGLQMKHIVQSSKSSLIFCHIFSKLFNNWQNMLSMFSFVHVVILLTHMSHHTTILHAVVGAYNFWLVPLPLPRGDLGNTFDVVFCEWVLHIPWLKVQTILLKLCCWKDSPNFQNHKIETQKKMKNPCSALDVKIWKK